MKDGSASRPAPDSGPPLHTLDGSLRRCTDSSATPAVTHRWPAQADPLQLTRSNCGRLPLELQLQVLHGFALAADPNLKSWPR